MNWFLKTSRKDIQKMNKAEALCDALWNHFISLLKGAYEYNYLVFLEAVERGDDFSNDSFVNLPNPLQFEGISLELKNGIGNKVSGEYSLGKTIYLQSTFLTQNYSYYSSLQDFIKKYHKKYERMGFLDAQDSEHVEELRGSAKNLLNKILFYLDRNGTILKDNILYHEIVHSLDHIEYGDEIGHKYERDFKSTLKNERDHVDNETGDFSEEFNKFYFNHPVEGNTWLLTIARQSLMSLETMDPKYRTFEKFLRIFIDGFQNWNHFSEQNKKKAISRLYEIYTEYHQKYWNYDGRPK